MISQAAQIRRSFSTISRKFAMPSRDCQAVVYVCQVEPRLYPRELPVTHEQYKKIQGGINNRLKKRLHMKLIHFNNCQFVQELAGDAVHWSETGRTRVEFKFEKAIKGFIGEDGSDE